ncbi:MAG: hypothetical protein V7719_13640 [Psychroserpens sp.]|uniref:hypothetical protein n=1 Tax=Psychroserpens sp. TaxID=2020870 RepID=UPI003003617D
MKILRYIIPCILLIIFMSCDKRTSKKERLEQAISEFNKNQKSIVLKSYYPEYYTEIKTDSIIASTFKVSVKNYALMDSGILINESVEGTKKTAAYHRVFTSDIIVAVSDKIIYDKQISVATFKAFSNSGFWQNATLEHVWVNQDNSTAKQLSFGISFINPKNDSFKLYEMQIDQYGNEHLTLIEDHS